MKPFSLRSTSATTLLFSLVTALAPAARAQTEVSTLPEIVVTAQEITPSLTVPSPLAAALEINATVAGAAEVIDAEEYKRGRAIHIKDALDYAPGVFVQPRFGAEESRISIRGSGLQRTFHGRGLALLQDGVPLNLADGSFDFQAIEPLAARYVEVYRGGNALLYGAANLGGAINFVSNTGLDAPPVTLRLGYGSFDSFQAQVASGVAQGPIDLFASFSHFSMSGFREHSRQDSWRFFGNIGYRFSEELETRFYLTSVITKSQLPGNLTKEELEADPRQAQRNAHVKMLDNVDSNWRRNFTLWRLANKTTFESGDHRFTLGAFWSQKRLDHPILFIIDQFSNDAGLHLRYDYTGDLFGKRNRFTLGLLPTYGQVQDNRYRNHLGNRGALFSSNRQTAANVALYGEEQFYLLPDLSVILGTQLTYAQRKNVDTFPVTPGNPDHGSTQDWWGFSPKLGILWDVAPDAQLYANVSRSFEPPSFGELTAPALGGAGLIDLRAQTATTLELGTRGNVGRFHWDFAWYYAWLDHELMEYQLLPGLSQTVNAGRTIHQGIEAAVEIDLLHGLFTHETAETRMEGKNVVATEKKARFDRIVLRQVYLWNDFRYDGDRTFGNNRLPGVPEHYYRAELTYEHPCGFYAGPNVEWVPRKYNVDSASTLFADPYALLGFKLGYRTERGFSFYLEGKNLTDERYAATTGVVSVATPNQALFLPGDGRGLYGGIEWRW